MFKSLKSRFIGATVLITILTIFFLTLTFSNIAISEMENVLETNAKKNVEFTENYIIAQYNNIHNSEKMLYESKMQELKSATDIIEAEISLIYQNYLNEKLTEEEAKRLVITTVSNARFNEDKGYFWIQELNDDVPKMIVYPQNPELNGKVLDHFSYNSITGTNENMFIYANDIAESQGDGYFEYYWYEDEQEKKVGYIRDLEMFDWVIATSFSQQEIINYSSQLLDKAVDELKEMSILNASDEDYFFVFNSNQEIIVHPIIMETDGSQLLNPITNESILRELMGVADIEDKYLSYTWNHVDDVDNYTYEKKAYVSYFEPLDWYISSTFYEESIRRPIRHIINIVIIITLIILTISILLLYFIGVSVTKPLRILVDKISNMNYNNLPDRIEIQGSDEVIKLTDSMNTMVDNIRSSKKDIQETHARLQGILDSATKMAIVTTDLKGLITSFNIGAENLLGFSSDDAANNISVLSFHLDSEVNSRSEKLLEKYNKKITGFGALVEEVDRTGYDEREWTFVKKDGSHIRVNLVITKVEDGEGNTVGYLGIANDITTKKETEEKLQNRTIELKRAVRNLIAHEEHLEDMVRERTMKLEVSLRTLQTTQNQLIESEKMALLGSLVAGVAHEINTPVGIGVTLASSLSDRTEKIKKLLEDEKLTRRQIDDYVNLMSELGSMLSRSMNQAADLVQSFKLVAVDQSIENRREFELDDYVHEILNSFGSKFERANIDIKVHSNVKIYLNSYPGTIYQIITNLLMNSIKHGFDGLDSGHIDLYLEQDEEFYTITYKDNGVGIEQNDVEKIFEPFYTTKRHKGGTGLGLNIVNNLVVQKLKGTITTESKLGEGVLFKIKIPKE